MQLERGKLYLSTNYLYSFVFVFLPCLLFYFAATYVPPERDKLLPRGESHWQVGGSKKEIIKLPSLPSHFHFISPPPSSSKGSNDSSRRHRWQYDQKITIIILFSIRRRGQMIPLINEGWWALEGCLIFCSKGRAGLRFNQISYTEWIHQQRW